MMGFLDGNHAAISASYIIPDSHFKNGSASTILGQPITPTSNFNGDKDVGRDGLIPALYGMVSVTDELRLGLGISAPFGLLTDNTGGWEGRYHALKSELLTIEINPTIAYRVLPNISIGGGFRAVYADVELSNDVDAGTICAADTDPGGCRDAHIALSGGLEPQPTRQDVRAKLDADDWGFGFNLGVMFEPVERLRFGLAYRSFIDLDVDGDADFDHSSSGLSGAILQAAGFLNDTGAESSVDLPDTAAFGVTIDVSDEWTAMGQVEWWNWSNFDELRVEFNDGQPDSVTEQNWDDSWFFAVGTTYKPKRVEGLTARLGLAFDGSPVPDETRTPRIPDEDRYWIAAGIGYTPLSWLTFDLGYTHIFMPDADIDLKATDPGNAARGNLSGKYESHIDIIALQGSVRF